MAEYNARTVEGKWQAYWSENKIFEASEDCKKPKFYVLDMFPYPSGAGLHLGHALAYTASDIYARYMYHRGYNVLHPMGYDSFGLPAEQYAVQTGQHPAVTTERNIKRYRAQLDRMGFSLDWSREIRTSSPSYYKWTQWIFIQLFNSWYNVAADRAEPIEGLIRRFEAGGNQAVRAACDEGVPLFSALDWKAFSDVEKQELLLKYRLAYRAQTKVNWCPGLGTVLAHDEVVNGVSARGGFPVIRKEMMQWNLRITAYAQRLLDDLEDLDWPEPVKDMQTHWIGRSAGARVRFDVLDSQGAIEVFTTRPDTIFGVTFLVLAPEHEAVASIAIPEYAQAVETYKAHSAQRRAGSQNPTGQFTGAYAVHPFTQARIPIWIADYVLASYGTAAVMAVPGGDQRDWDFAAHFGLPIKNIFSGVDISKGAYSDPNHTCMAQSEFLNGLTPREAARRVVAELERLQLGGARVNFRLRDAAFSRQRYWGEPFPVYYKNGLPQLIDAAHLPLALPDVDAYTPTETGEPPLGRAGVWAWDTRGRKVVSNDRIDGKTVFPLARDTMPGWAGSAWYFNRYMDARNEGEWAAQKALNYWRDVDLYIGGIEHATGHLLYSRFWQKFLCDRGWAPVSEYARKLVNQGMVWGMSAFVFRIVGTRTFVSKNLAGAYKTTPLHVDISLVNASQELDLEGFRKWRPEYADAEFILEDGKYITDRVLEKMSKSKYNVVNPDDIIERYSADTLRLYAMFLGPLTQSKPWDTAGIKGVHSFLKKLWRLYHRGGALSLSAERADGVELKILHQTTQKVGYAIEHFTFNTGVSALMIAVNELQALRCDKREILAPLSILLSPYAPHMAEELWHEMGHSESIAHVEFPSFDPELLVSDSHEYPILFNGKLRFKMRFAADTPQRDMEVAVLGAEKTSRYLTGKTPKKIIVVPGKIINVVY
ncbi:MAG: leucine--tRNA ligase [Flavobacteriales bacterium]